MMVHIFKNNPLIYIYKGRFTVRLMMLKFQAPHSDEFFLRLWKDPVHDAHMIIRL